MTKSNENVSMPGLDVAKPSMLTLGLTLLVFFIGFMVRYYRLDEVSVWLDEAWTFHGVFRTENRYSDILEIGGFYKIFFYLLSHVVDLYDEVYYRGNNILFGALTCALAYRLSLKFTGQAFALLTALLTIVSPLLINYSQDASVYIFCSFFVTLQFFLYLEWTKNFDFKLAAIFGLVCFIVINTRAQLVAFTFVLMLAALFCGPLKQEKKLKSIALATLIMAPSFYTVLKAFIFIGYAGGDETAMDWGGLAQVYHLTMTALFNLPNSHTVYSPYGVFALYNEHPDVFRYFFGGFFIASLLYNIVCKNRPMVVLGAAIVVLTLVTALGMLKSNQLFERYLLFIQPLILVFCLVPLGGLAQRFKWSQVVSIPLILSVAIFWAHLSEHSSYGKEVRWKPPHREVFAKVEPLLSPQITSSFIVPYFFEWPIAHYYLNGRPNVELMELTFDFYADLEQALKLRQPEYVELTMAQVAQVKQAKVEQIFVFTRRGRNVCPEIQQALEDSYEMTILYDQPTALLQRYRLKSQR